MAFQLGFLDDVADGHQAEDAQDQSTCLEEDMGHEPYRPRGRDQRLAGDRRVAYDDELTSLVKRIEPAWGFSSLEHEAQTARSARLQEQREARIAGRNPRQMAYDADAAAAFDARFPDIARDLARIKTGMFG